MILLGTDNGNAIFFRYEGAPDFFRRDTNFNEDDFEKVFDGSQFSLPMRKLWLLLREE